MNIDSIDVMEANYVAKECRGKYMNPRRALRGLQAFQDAREEAKMNDATVDATSVKLVGALGQVKASSDKRIDELAAKIDKLTELITNP
tara:strand:+ start:103 stop:369 length:267 start_codon:yes stop_codon:yes gene_type:complete